MSFDIYGNNLRSGYCEVHPDVHQSYPCSLCYAERKKVDDAKRMKKEHYRQMEINHQRDMEIEEQKHSFARSQAIGFNKWCDGLTDDQRYGNDYEFLYKKFLLYQKKQQEGKGE